MGFPDEADFTTREMVVQEINPFYCITLSQKQACPLFFAILEEKMSVIWLQLSVCADPYGWGGVMVPLVHHPGMLLNK